MSHTVSSKARADREGGFSFECRDYAGDVFRAQGGFATQPDAIRAAEAAERDMTMAANLGPVEPVDWNDPLLDDDALLAELAA